MGLFDRWRYRRGTSTYWASNNVVLAMGEPGWDITNRSGKVGDGVTPWNDLPISFGTGVAPAPPAATTTVSGVSRMATPAETIAGASTATSTTPAGVKAAIDSMRASLLGAAPAALDTLVELGTALGNDANFAATVTNSLAGKQAAHGNLSALSALASAADRLPYFSGTGTMSLATFTSLARTLLSRSTNADMRTDLDVYSKSEVDNRTTTGRWDWVVQNADGSWPAPPTTSLNVKVFFQGIPGGSAPGEHATTRSAGVMVRGVDIWLRTPA